MAEHLPAHTWVPKHRFYLASASNSDDRISFEPEQARQIASVLRLKPGHRVRVFDGRSRADYAVELTDVKARSAAGRIVGTVDQAPEPRAPIAVYPALLHRGKFEQVLQKLVEVGAHAITPVLTTRSIVREPPDEKRLTRWRAIVREAAEQSERGILPDLNPACSFGAALEQATANGPTLLAYEEERELTLKTAVAPYQGLRREASRANSLPFAGEGPEGWGISLFVGPEGGYTPEEVALARERGVNVITLGPRILRTETASPILAALVLHELEG